MARDPRLASGIRSRRNQLYDLTSPTSTIRLRSLFLARPYTRLVGESETAANPFPVVGVGASAGGLEALTHLIGRLAAPSRGWPWWSYSISTRITRVGSSAFSSRTPPSSVADALMAVEGRARPRLRHPAQHQPRDCRWRVVGHASARRPPARSIRSITSFVRWRRCRVPMRSASSCRAPARMARSASARSRPPEG